MVSILYAKILLFHLYTPVQEKQQYFLQGVTLSLLKILILLISCVSANISMANRKLSYKFSSHNWCIHSTFSLTMPLVTFSWMTFCINTVNELEQKLLNERFWEALRRSHQILLNWLRSTSRPPLVSWVFIAVCDLGGSLRICVFLLLLECRKL